MKAIDAVAGYNHRSGLDPVIVGIIAFFGLHMLIRLFGTSNFVVDETVTAINAQALRPSYSLRNPPLFDWLFYGMSQVTGINVFTMQLMKTVIMIGAGVFLYLALRPVFRHRQALDAAIISYGATIFYGWELFQLFSHTVTLIFAMAFTLWAFMRLLGSRQFLDYVLLGVGLGLGLLSKYLFALYFFALLLAALRSANYRRAILSWRLLLTFAIALVLVSPLLFGLSGQIDAVGSTLGGRVGSGNGPDIEAFAYLLLLIAEFWFPFVVILWLCLVRWPGGSETGGHGAAVDESFYPLMRDTTVIVTGAISAGILFGSSNNARGWYLVAGMSLLPVVIFAGIDRRRQFPSLALRYFWQATAVFIVAVAVVRFLLFLFVSPPFCVPRCVVFVDYRPVLEKIDTTSGKQNVVLTNDLHMAANLLHVVPNARVVIDAYTSGSDLGIAEPADRNCYFIWFQRYRDANEQPLAAALRRSLRREPLPSELAAIGPPAFVTADWQTYLREWGPDTIIGVAKIDSGQRICEGGRIPGLSAPPNNNTMQ